MKRCETFLVHLVDVRSTLNELVHHHVLPVVAGHVKGRVAVRVGLIDLEARKMGQCLHDWILMETNWCCTVALLRKKWVNGLVGGTYVHPEVQEVFDHADHSTGGCSMQGSVRFLIFAGHLSSVRCQQLYHFYVP